MTRLVILDRDGVINHETGRHIRRAEHWLPLPGALQAIAMLTRAGFAVAIATNQSGVGRGLLTPSDLDAVHAELVAQVAGAGGRIDAIFVCPHHPDALCPCRKPRPEMLLRACAVFGVPPATAAFVGDSLRDISAAVAAGCRPVLVLSGNGLQTRSDPDLPQGTEIFADLLDFAIDRCPHVGTRR